MKIASQLRKVSNISFTIRLMEEYLIDSLPVKSPIHEEVLTIYNKRL